MNTGTRLDTEKKLARLDLLNRLLHERAWHLHFPEELEREFSAQQLSIRVSAVQLGGIIAIPLYMLTSLFEFLYIPIVAQNILPARSLAILTLAAVVLLVTFTRARQRAEGLAIGMTLILASLQMIIALLNPPPFQQAQILVGLLPLIYLCTVVRASFFYSVTAAVLVYLLIFVTVRGLSSLEGLSVLFTLELAMAISLVVLVSSYFGERITRQRFLQGALLQLHRQRLMYPPGDEIDQRALDPGTGALTREALESRLQAMLGNLSHSIAAGQGISLLLIRADHAGEFKQLYGEQETEFLMATVARTAQRLIGGGHSFVARAGEDRLAIVLERSMETDALTMAERLRRDVHMLGIPHALDDQINTVTVSCGIAHSSRVRELNTDSLMSAAQAALRSAQRRGGNRSERFTGFVNG